MQQPGRADLLPAPPPQKSRTGLIFGIGCGGLLLSCAGCIAFAAIFGPSKEELEARREREVREIEAYYEQVAAVYPNVPLPSTTVTRCPTLARDPATQRGVLSLPTVRYESLADWARQPTQGTGATWEWLDSIERENLTGERPTRVHSIWQETQEAARLRYLVVVRPILAVAPDVGDGESWEGGTFSGSLFVFDTQTAQIVCHAPFAAVSSTSVETGGGVRIGRLGPTVGDTDLEDAITEDMEQQTVRALRTALGQMSEEIALDTRPRVQL